MSRTGILFGVIVVLAVVYFIISKAGTALNRGTSAIKQGVSTSQEQPEQQVDQVQDSLQEEGVSQ